MDMSLPDVDEKTAQLYPQKESTFMTTQLQVNDQFPDIALPDHQNELRRLSHFKKPGLLDQHLGFLDGAPLILVFFRGFFCPRDQQQMRQLVAFQHELAVNYGKLVAVSADPPLVQAAFRAGLGAQWTFLSDEQRTVIKLINILDETEGEYAYRAQPFTFVLRPDLRIHAIYNGWYFVGRPTNEELRHDLRESWKRVPITVTRHMTRRRCGHLHSPARVGRWCAAIRRERLAGCTGSSTLVRSQCGHWHDRTGGLR